MPSIPEQIIVTFEGQTREVMHIRRGKKEEQTPSSPYSARGRPRYYVKEERQRGD